MSRSPEQIALSEAKAALAQGVSPNEVVDEVYGLTRVHIAAREGQAQALEYLLTKGGDPNVVNTGGRGTGGETPLHWASTAEVVDILVRHGADLEELGAAGQSALASAALRNRPSAAVRLLELGLDVNDRDMFHGNSALIWACSNISIYDDPKDNRISDRITLIKLLVEHGAYLDMQDRDGWTALHFVAINGSVEIAELLLEAGADPTLKNDEGKTPLDLSLTMGSDSVAKTFRDAMESR